MDTLSEAPPYLLIAVIVVLCWLVKELWDYRKRISNKHDSLLQQNTLALVELKVEVKNLKETISPLLRKTEKLEKDVNSLHEARRQDRGGKSGKL
jgi:uncharacterized protein YoxC